MLKWKSRGVGTLHPESGIWDPVHVEEVQLQFYDPRSSTGVRPTPKK